MKKKKGKQKTETKEKVQNEKNDLNKTKTTKPKKSDAEIKKEANANKKDPVEENEKKVKKETKKETKKEAKKESKKENETKEVQNKLIKREVDHFRILGISLWRIFAYFIIYSIIGFVVETLFGIARYGVLESRQSFLYGPFCAIYGVGAIVMILSLQYFKKNYNTLFIGGCLVGSVVEYIISWLGEVFLHVKWWDYSKVPLNINGRICLLYSIFWGFLGLYLMISLNPKIDKMINFIKERISVKALQTFVVISTIIMFLDLTFTAIALDYFTVRTIKENNIEVKHAEYVDYAYEKICNSEFRMKIIDKFWNNEKMLRTFPRLTVQDANGNMIKVRELYPDIQTYYFKFIDDNDD